MQSNTTVLIAGAGPVGVSAALALSRAGIDCQIIDAGDGVDTRMRASTFHPPTLDLIDDLGLCEDLQTHGLVAPTFQMRQHEDQQQVTFDLAGISSDTRHPYRLQVEQHRYCMLAVKSLTDRGISVSFNTRLSAARESGDHVIATTDQGDIHAGWLIGADGSTSQVRKSLNLDYAGKTYTHSSVLVSTTFPFHEHLENLSAVNYCWSERGPFSLLQLKNFWRASLYPGQESLEDAANESRIRDWLASIHPQARDAEIIGSNPYRVHERCVDKFRVGRILLAGDAAHLNPPSGGMGMNGGIHDAINLSEKLTRVLAGESEKLMDLYDRQRRTVVAGSIIPQAAANRQRMATTDRSLQRERLADLKRIAEDPQKCREFLLRSSMIAGLREAASIE